MSKTDKMIVHAEAALGSSLIDLRIENADAVQLLALAEMLHANGMAALMGQMAQAAAESKPSPKNIIPIHRSLDS
jgi:hypothetical protein